MGFLYLLLLLLFVWSIVTLVFTVNDHTVWYKRETKAQLEYFGKRFWYWFKHWFSELMKTEDYLK